MSYDDVRKQLMQATYQKNTGSQATQAKSAASTPAPARSSGYDEVYAQLESSLGSDARLRDARNRAGQASGVQTPAATTSSYDEKTNTLYYEGPLAEQYVKMYSDNYRAIQPVWEQREKEQMYSAFGVDNDEDLKAALDEYYQAKTAWEEQKKAGNSGEDWYQSAKKKAEDIYARLEKLRALRSKQDSNAIGASYIYSTVKADTDEEYASLSEEYREAMRALNWAKQYRYSDIPETEGFDTISAAGNADAEEFRKTREMDYYGAQSVADYMPGLAGLVNLYQNDESYHLPTDDWTEEERGIFGYLWQTDRDRAFEYAQGINDERKYKQRQAQLDEMTKDVSFGEWAAARVAVMASGVDYLDKAAEYLARGTVTQRANVSLTDYANAIDSAIAENLNKKSGTISEDVFMLGGKGLGDVYQIGMSTIDSIVSIAAAGRYGTLAVFFGRAASSGFDEAMRRGVTPGQALAIGFAEGCAEAIFEEFSVDKIIELSRTGMMKDIIKNIITTGAIEGGEELATSIANFLSDKVIARISGGDRKTDQQIKQLMSDGMDYDEAWKSVARSTVGDMAYDTLAGSISGGLHAVGATSIGAIRQGSIERRVRGALQNQGYEESEAKELANIAARQAAGWEIREAEQEKLDTETEKIKAENRKEVMRGILDRAQEETEAPAETAPTAQQRVESVLAGGTVSNRIAETIINDPELAQAFTEMTGVELTGSKSEQRKAVKDAAANYGQQQAERERAARERLGITVEDVAARNAETQAENLTAELTEEQKKQNRTETMRGILSRSSEAAGVQMTDEEATAIAEGYEAGTNGRLYAAAATDAYKLGKSGQYSLEEAMKASQYTARISADQFRRAFETGAGAEAVETNAVDAGTEEGKQTLTAALSSLGEHAEDAASAYEAGQDVSIFAAGMSEAAERYAVTGADIRAQEGGVPAESVISTLTDAQIEKAQEIGGRLRETRAAAVSQLAEQRKAIRAQAQAIEQQGAADAAALTEIDRQIREANKLGKETVEMFEAQRDALTKAAEADPDFQNTEEYAKAFDEAKANMDRVVELQKSVKELQDKKKELEGKAPAKRKKGTVSLDGGNIAGTDYAGIDRGKLNRQQQNIVAMVERLADFINIDYVVFDGPANMGGAYMQGGRLYININAGMTQEGRKSIAAASLSHELTHFMQEYAPEEYQQLKDYVVKTILNKSQTEFDRMIRQQRRWEPGKSYDELADELVANACQTMLTDDKAVQRMARSNMTLAQKVADVLDEIGEKIRKAFEGLSFDEDRAIFAPVKAVMDEIDGITERWADGISAAVENYNAEQTVRQADEQRMNELDAQIRDAEDTTQDREQRVAGLDTREQTRVQFQKWDDDYAQAVQNGDTETEKKLVAQAAKRAGYQYHGYHGTLATDFTEFKKEFVGTRFSFDEKGFFFIDRQSIAKDYATSEFDSSRKGRVIDAYLRIRKPLVVDKAFVLKEGLGNIFRDDDVIDAWDNYSSYFIEEADNMRADGIIVDDGSTKMFVVFDGEQIKSADPVTYDDAGNVIPLSSRFNRRERDFRFQRFDETSDDDSDYMDAVERGDMETAQLLVNKAAVDAGAIPNKSGRGPLHLYHGTPSFGFSVFRPGVIFLTDNRSIAAGYTKNKGYGRVRKMSESYTSDDGTDATLLKNAKNVLEQTWRLFDEKEAAKLFDEVKKTAVELNDRVNNVYTSEALDVLNDLMRGMDEDEQNDLYNALNYMISLPGTVVENIDDFKRGDYSYWGTVEDAVRSISFDIKSIEACEEQVKDFLRENRDKLKGTVAWDLYKFLMGYDLGDFSIDVQYKMLNAMQPEGKLISINDSVATKDAIREQIEKLKSVGSYDMYGFAGNNPLVIDGKGAFWTNIEAPMLGEGTFSTDTIAELAPKRGYTSVQIKNIMDSSMNEYATNVHSDVFIFFDSSQVKSADTVTYDDKGNVIPLSERFNRDTGDIRYQRFDDTSDDTASESRGRDIAYARLQSENAILSETVAAMKKLTGKQGKTIAALQKRLQVTTTPEVRQGDARKLARQLIRENGSKADVERVSEQLKALGDYILQTETAKLDENEMKSRARAIAAEILNSATEQISAGDDTFQRIAGEIKGRKLSIDEDFLGELDQAGGYDAFRKSVFGSFTLAKRESARRETRDGYMTVDQFYTDMQGAYGKGLFPDAANEGEQVQILARMLDAAKPMEVNPFEQYMGEATEEMANRIVMDAMNGVLRQTAPTTADRQKARTQALKEQIDQLKAENKLEQREAASLYHTVYDLTVALDKAQSKYQTLRTEADYRAAQLRAEGTARAVEIKAAERERAAKQITALKEHYRDMQERARERRGNTATRGKIRKLIADLNQRLVHPTEFKHVPKELTRATIDLLEMIDDPKAYRTEKGALDAAARIADIRQVYESYKSNPDFPGVYDEAISEMLDTLAQNVRGTTLRDMNETQLQAVYRALQAMTHVVNDAVKVKIGNEERNAFQMAREMTKETREVPKAQKGWLREHGIPAHLRADVAFDRFGGFKKNSTWQQAARLLNDGQLKQTHLKMQLSKPFANLFNNQKALSEFTGMNALGKVDAKKLVDVGLKDENGNAIPITRDFMVALYMDLLNEDNRRHFIRGGKKVPDFQAFYDGKGGYKIGAKSAVGIAAQLSKAYHELEQAKAEGRAENGGRYVRSVFEGTEIGERVNKAEAKIAELESEGEKYADEVKAKIESLMTDYDRAWVEATKQLMDVDSKRELNKTTMEVYGIEKARVDNYFPIFTDEDFVSTQMETVTKDASLENAGFMKERVESGNPTHAVGMVWAVTHQIDRVAQYCGLMPAIRNFGKVYSKAEPGYTDSLKNALSSTFGEAGTDYVENLIADLQGARKGEHDELGIDKMLGGLRGNLARSTLTLNPRVALAQAASFPTAAAELGYGPIMKALAHGGKNGKVISRADQELIAKWSPLLWYRMQGYATPELGDIQSSNRFGDRVWRKARYVTGWIQAVDGATVGRLWYAAEYWVQEHKADLEKGSDAYYEAVAEKFNDVVEKTQPNYTTMQRAAILRNPNSLVKTFTMFMTQRLQNFNILYDAAGRYQKARADFANNRNGVTKADVSEARANVTRAVTSQIAAQAMFVGIKVAVDFLLHSIKRYRDDETGDITAESTSLAILDAFCDALVGTVVFGSELYEIAKAATGHGKWYGLSISGVDTIGDLIESMVNLTNGTYDLEDEKSRKTLYNRTMKLAANIAQALGYPLNNALKMGQAVYYHIVDAANGEFGSFEAGYDRTTTQNANKIILALETGDDAAVQAATEAFENEKDALSAVRAQIKKQYEAGDRTAEEAVSLLEKAGMDGNDAWFAVNSWETGDSSRYTAVKRAALSGDKAAFQQAMTVLTAHGVKQKDVYSQIKTFVKNAYFGNELSEADTEILGGKKLSDADTRTLLAKYCGLTADEAVELVASWEETKSFVAAHGSEYERYGLTVPQAKYYYEQVKGAASLSSYAVYVEKYGLDTVKAYYGDGETSWRETGLTIDHYNTYRTGYSECKGVDRNGDGKADPYTKQEQVLQLIDSLPVSDEVKDALYLKNGYSRRNIGSAPWRRRG